MDKAKILAFSIVILIIVVYLYGKSQSGKPTIVTPSNIVSSTPSKPVTKGLYIYAVNGRDNSLIKKIKISDNVDNIEGVVPKSFLNEVKSVNRNGAEFHLVVDYGMPKTIGKITSVEAAALLKLPRSEFIKNPKAWLTPAIIPFNIVYNNNDIPVTYQEIEANPIHKKIIDNISKLNRTELISSIEPSLVSDRFIIGFLQMPNTNEFAALYDRNENITIDLEIGKVIIQ